MANGIRYAHTNLIAKDWRKLADFYLTVFNCKPLPPERDLHGDWLDQLTTIPHAHIRGVQLALPGYDNGPTLEVFQYDPPGPPNPDNRINRLGFGHLAFLVDSVDDVLKAVLDHGGTQLGELVKRDYGSLGLLTAVYAADPEGNFLEIQNWAK
jgi:catechol 2,3-dioxygenase-like lactoylglutathione lyase family enzyme